MLMGMGLMSTLAASITTYFVQQSANTESKELDERLDRIESMLEHLGQVIHAEHAKGEWEAGQANDVNKSKIRWTSRSQRAEERKVGS